MRVDNYGRPIFDQITIMDFLHNGKRLSYFRRRSSSFPRLVISPNFQFYASSNYSWRLHENIFRLPGGYSQMYFQSMGTRFYIDCGLLVNINTSDIYICIFENGKGVETWVSSEFDSVKSPAPGVRKVWRRFRRELIDSSRFIYMKDQETMNQIKYKPSFQFKSVEEMNTFKNDLLLRTIEGMSMPYIYGLP